MFFLGPRTSFNGLLVYKRFEKQLKDLRDIKDPKDLKDLKDIKVLKDLKDLKVLCLLGILCLSGLLCLLGLLDQDVNLRVKRCNFFGAEEIILRVKRHTLCVYDCHFAGLKMSFCGSKDVILWL